MTARLATAAGATALGALLMAAVGLGPVAAQAATSVAAPTRTHLTVSPTAPTSTAAVSLLAAVKPIQGSAVPGGTVTFLEGSTWLGSAAVMTSPQGRRVAMIRVFLTVGSHSVTATYNGDAGTASSTSAPVTVQVTQGAPLATTSTLTQAPGIPPHSAVLSAHVADTVHGGVPVSGPVSFTVDHGPAQMVALNSIGRARLKVFHLAAGAHTATVSYPGDSNHRASTATLSFSTS